MHSSESWNLGFRSGSKMGDIEILGLPAGMTCGFVTTTPLSILRNTFGFQDFRGVQEQVIGRVMAGQHTLAVMPTGSGKSLCYQVPALARTGTALVISPLIALMHDQIRAADAFGLRAAALTSADGNRAETVERLEARRARPALRRARAGDGRGLSRADRAACRWR